MTKKKPLILTTLLLVFTLALSCIVLTACGEKEKHAITWTYESSMVTVTAVGADALPTELEEEAEFSFNVAPVNGYQIGTVTGAKKQEDGSYKVTMGTSDVTVKINASKVLNDIEVKVPATLTFFEDQTVDTSLLTVTAKYVLGDEVITNYTISYQNGSAFAVGDTSFTVSFGGKSKEIALTSPVTAAQEFYGAQLIVENDVVYLVANGNYNAAGTVEEAEATVEGWFNNCMERGTWASMTYNVDVTMNEDKTFTLKASVEGMTPGRSYYFHIKDGADGQDFTCSFANGVIPVEGANNNEDYTIKFPGDEGYTGQYDADAEATFVETSDGTKYYIGTIPNWGSKALIICPINPNAPEVTVSTLALEDRDGVATLVITGTSLHMTEEAFAAYYLDYEDSEGVKTLTVTVDSFNAETGEFVLSADVSAAPAGTNWLHIAKAGNNLAAGETVEGKTEITVGEKTYTFNYSEYNCWQIVVA